MIGEDELKAIESRAEHTNWYGPAALQVERDVLTLVAEVRRLRRFMKPGDLEELDAFDKREAERAAGRAGAILDTDAALERAGLGTARIQEIARMHPKGVCIHCLEPLQHTSNGFYLLCPCTR